MPGPKSHKATNLPYRKAASDEFTYGDIGGEIIELIAAATLKLGELVILSAADTVNKAVATPEDVIGVVVGGQQTANYVVTEKTQYNNLVAANANERVLVLIRGISYVITDAAQVAGQNVVQDTVTAGRVKAAGAGARGLGILLEASGGVAGVARVFVYGTPSTA